MSAPRCTCSGDAARCGTCVAFERIDHEIRNDQSELVEILGGFHPEQYAELDAMAAEAFVTGDWTQHNARKTELIAAGITARATALLSDRYGRALTLVARMAA